MPAKGRVLLLDDDPTPESSAAIALRAENYQVFLAGNCRQAVEISRTVSIDFVVLNSALQTEALPQLIAMLSAEDQPCPILVIARSLEQLILVRDGGADAILIKPNELGRLGTVVNNLLAEGGLHTLAERRHQDTPAPVSRPPPPGVAGESNEADEEVSLPAVS
jgi:DNA-binding response OmpR family regulator